MKKAPGKLSLNRETLHNLALAGVAGGTTYTFTCHAYTCVCSIQDGTCDPRCIGSYFVFICDGQKKKG
jgi:hypothetical protein